MVDLFFYKKIEDVEEQQAEETGEEKGAAKEDKKWDNQAEEAEGAEEEQWNA